MRKNQVIIVFIILATVIVAYMITDFVNSPERNKKKKEETRDLPQNRADSKIYVFKRNNDL